MPDSELPENLARFLQLEQEARDAIDEDAPSPEWHGEILAERLKEIESGTAKFLTLSELKKRLGR
jgi:hypothetical protein